MPYYSTAVCCTMRNKFLLVQRSGETE